MTKIYFPGVGIALPCKLTTHTPSPPFREAKDTIARLTEGGAGATKTAEDEETTHLVQEQEEKPTADEVEANVEAEEGHGEKRKLAENTEGWLIRLFTLNFLSYICAFFVVRMKDNVSYWTLKSYLPE